MSVSDVSRTYCLKAARTMTFLPTSSPSPQRFYRTWAKQMSPELGEVVTSVCVGGKASGRGSDERGFEAGSLRGQALVQSSLGMSAQHSPE